MLTTIEQILDKFECTEQAACLKLKSQIESVFSTSQHLIAKTLGIDDQRSDNNTDLSLSFSKSQNRKSDLRGLQEIRGGNNQGGLNASLIHINAGIDEV